MKRENKKAGRKGIFFCVRRDLVFSLIRATCTTTGQDLRGHKAILNTTVNMKFKPSLWK